MFSRTPCESIVHHNSSNERTDDRTMGAEGKRRLLTLDDITPRLRGATGVENANGCEDERAAHQEKGNRLEWESCSES